MKLQVPHGPRALASGRVLGTLFVLVLVLWAYSESVHHGSLNYDDPMYISNPGGASDGLDLGTLGWCLTNTRSNLWHPLTWLSFQLECAAVGNSQWQWLIHHLTNLLLYLATLMVIALGLARLELPIWPSVAFLALFALHPLHVESVAWISSRKDVLSGLFLALCLLAYLDERKSSHRPWRTLVFFALALLSKPSAVVIPALLIVMDEALRKKEGKPSRLASFPEILRQISEKRWFWSIALLAALGTIWVQAHGSMAGVSQTAGLLERLTLIPAKVGAYLGKILFPVHLTFEYPVPRSAGLIAFSLLGLATILLPVVEYLRHRAFSWLGLALLWMLICISPVLGWFFVSDSFINDRYAFWALAGPVAWLTGFTFRLPGKATFVVSILVVALLLAATRRQVWVWRNDENLFGHALSLYPAHLTALGNMGTLERARGNENLALDYYNRALEINPRDHIVLYNKAQILARKGRLDEAIETCRRCLEAYPGYERAQALLKHLLSKGSDGSGPSR